MEDKKLKTGTTTVGLICKDAVVLAADRKASMGYLVASKEEKKILKMDDHIAITTAGSVGDLQALDRYLRAELRLHKLQEESEMPPKNLATLLANILYSRKIFPYWVQVLVGGFGSKPELYSLMPDGSVIEEKKFFSTGSGSPMVFGVMENRFKENMDVEDAKKLAVKAVAAAIERDIASGGTGIDLLVVDRKGCHESIDEDVKKLLK